MKQFVFMLVIPLLFPFYLAAQVKVYAQIEKKQSQSLSGLEGTIFITHKPQSHIEISSFTLDERPLPVSFIKKEPLSKNLLGKEILNPSHNLMISTFRFYISQQPVGLHLLPSISVLVDGKVYKSPQTTYEVNASETLLGPLNLRAEIIGNHPLYPGQRAKMVYRIFYKGTIDLTREILPLLEAKGFRKIGGIEINETTKDDYDEQEIIQEVQAVNPGNFSFSPSLIEGTLHQFLPGQASLSQKAVRSELPAVLIEVLPFPENGKPPSFNGALGQFVYQVRLASSSKINLGDTIKLEIVASGNGEMDTLSLPEIICQPGFSGFFEMGDLPIGEKTDRGSKVFLLDLRPNSTVVNEIPSIEFSSFDPLNNRYLVTQSQSIPLVITTLKSTAKEKLKVQTMRNRTEEREVDDTNWTAVFTQNQASKIFPDEPLKENFFWLYWLTSWKVLFLVPLVIGLLICQVYLKDFLNTIRKKSLRLTSQHYLTEASKNLTSHPSFGLALIEKALLLGLQEKGYITHPLIAPEELATEGMMGNVRSFLQDIEEIRFAGKKEKSLEKVLLEARRWYNQIMQ